MLALSTTSSTPASGTGTRSLAIDMAKGVAICLVVFGHALRGLIKGGSIEPSSFWSNIDYIIYTFHMPIFFLFAGYFFRSGKDKDRSFWTSRLQTIVYPYFLWSLIHGGLQVALSGSSATNGAMDTSRLYAILWDPIIPFWFLYALFFCYVLRRLLTDFRPGIVLAGAFIVFLASFAVHPTVLSDIAYGFFYFMVGGIVRKYDLLTRIPTKGYFVVLAFIMFIALSLLSNSIGIPERLPIVSAMLGMIVVYAWCASLEKSSVYAVLPRGLVLLGQCSMGIYVMHITVIGLVRLILLRILHLQNDILLLSLITVFAIAIPMVVQVIAIKLNVDRLFGMPASGNLIKRSNWNMFGTRIRQ